MNLPRTVFAGAGLLALALIVPALPSPGDPAEERTTIAGLVVDRRTGLGVDGAHVEYGPEGQPRAFRIDVDADGRFVLPGLEAGTWELLPVHDEYMPSRPVDVETPRGWDVYLFLVPGGAIEGGVAGAGDGWTVALRPRDGETAGVAPARAFRFGELRKGAYVLTVRDAAGAVRGREEVAIVDGQRVEVEIPLDADHD